jgi:uncharacterized protein YsxB (DUF464 family)
LIEVEAVLDESDVLRACTASGHAKAGKKGFDIVCAAVSALMRTAACALSDRKGIPLRYKAPEPGFFSIEADYTADGREFLYAAGVFLIEGFALIAEEYPQYCRLTIRRI